MLTDTAYALVPGCTLPEISWVPLQPKGPSSELHTSLMGGKGRNMQGAKGSMA